MLNKKIQSIVLEYCLRKDNEHIGSGKGGNILYFGYLSGKENVITPDVKNVEINNGKLLWNPEFLTNSNKEIREQLDQVIADNIKAENFQFAISDDLKCNEKLISDQIKNINTEKILFDNAEIPDINALGAADKLVLALRICANFATYLDNEHSDKYNKSFCDVMSKFDIGTILFSIRTQINIKRIVANALDEDKDIGPLISKMNISC